jgi:hypothetical protein
MTGEVKLVYTDIDTDICVGAPVMGHNICHGWLLDSGEESPEQVICDITKCPLLTAIAKGEDIK